MAKMPMIRDPKTGKMVPSFAMDGKGAGDLKKAAKGGAIKMAKGGMAAKGMAKGGAVMAKGGSVKMAKGGAVMAKGGSVKMAGGGMTKGYKAGGMMAKGYKVGGVATKGGTKGGVTGGKKTAKKRDGIAKRGKTRA